MATVRIDLGRPKKRIKLSRFILGHFIEHLGLCIENGIWTYDDTSNELLGKEKLERVRKDLFQVIEALNPPIIRYPGGCFSDTYHWKDGIGPRETRPVRKNKAWGGYKNTLYKLGPKERNHFGTDEFLTLCDELGAAPYLNVNFGSGTPEEAAEWVEYVNGGANTVGGKLRRENGHVEPYNVKIWGIANEIYGFWEIGDYRNKPREYGEKYLEFARVMKESDPTIELVAVGHDGSSDWNRPLLEVIKDEVDYLSIHKYFGMKPGILGAIQFFLKKSPFPATEAFYYILLNSPCTYDKLITSAEEDITSALGGDGLERCKIAFDEWNIWASGYQGYRADKPPVTLREGLWTTLILNTFFRHGHSIGMANFSQLVNCLGMILTYEDGVVLTPHYLAFKMYVDGWQPWLVPVDIDCDAITSEVFSKVFPAETAPLLDSIALTSEDGKQLSIFCVNKHFSNGVECEFDIEGNDAFEAVEEVEACILTNDSPFAFNSREKPKEVELQKEKIKIKGLQFVHELPPHSVCCFKMEIK
ncbi:MAG: alpha-L-arabinofuranosidase C-terminal domain-containing protein [Candidatus Hodarchaeota archaeon]